MSISGIGGNAALAMSLQSLVGATGGGTSASSTSSTVSSESYQYDEKDTNQDGVVSALEEIEWAMKHPGEETGELVDVLA